VTRNEILRRYPNASAAFIRANVTHGSPPGPEPKQAVRPRAHGKVQGTQEDSPRYSIRIIACRKRLIDPDNLCGKFFIDALRYAGVILEDTASVMDYSISQQKTQPGQEEYAIINIQRIS
jgi:hypothetical protein